MTDQTPVAPARPRVLFLGSGYAGHLTRFRNLEQHAREDSSLSPAFGLVSGWDVDGAIERLPLLPSGIKGRLRAMKQAAAVLRVPRPDAIWTAGGRELAPFIWPQRGPLARPLVLDLDWTLEQQEDWAPLYFGRPRRRSVRMSLARAMQKMLWNRVTLFSPWSEWAAQSLRRGGVDDSRIRVNPPGVDLEKFRPQPRMATDDGPLRLLFIGGDFARKGGDILIEAVRARDDCELDIITRDEVDAGGPVRVHRAEPNSPLLLELLARADVFVMPTRAECFGIATVEAMASGLPAIVGDVGAAKEIVSDGETGWLIEPAASSLAAALERAVAERDRLPGMGARARAAAEERYDGEANNRRVVDTVREAIAIFEGRQSAPRASTEAIQ